MIAGKRAEPGALAIMERAVELDGDRRHSHVLRQASNAMGFFLRWADRLEEFRASMDQLYRRAVNQGDESSIPALLNRRCWVEISLGNLPEARRLMEQALEASPRPGEPDIWHLLLDAEVSGLLGLVDRARDAGQRALALGEADGENWPRMNALGMLGFLELSLGRPAEAHDYLARAVASAEAASVLVSLASASTSRTTSRR